MTELAEKVVERDVDSGGTGRTDYLKDFRSLTEIDKTHMELPYTLATYWEVSNTSLAIGETKSYRMIAYGESQEQSESRDRYFVHANWGILGYIGVLDMTPMLEKVDTAFLSEIYYILNAVTYPIIRNKFTWKHYRSITWSDQPILELNINPPQIIKIPAGAQFWMKLTNRSGTFVSGAGPMAAFMEIT